MEASRCFTNILALQTLLRLCLFWKFLQYLEIFRFPKVPPKLYGDHRWSLFQVVPSLSLRLHLPHCQYLRTPWYWQFSRSVTQPIGEPIQPMQTVQYRKHAIHNFTHPYLVLPHATVLYSIAKCYESRNSHTFDVRNSIDWGQDGIRTLLLFRLRSLRCLFCILLRNSNVLLGSAIRAIKVMLSLLLWQIQCWKQQWQ